MNTPLLIRREAEVLILSNNNVAARNALSPEFYAAVTTALVQAQRTAALAPSSSRVRGATFAQAVICASWPSAGNCLCRSAAKSSRACTT